MTITKELLIHLRKQPPSVSPITVDDEIVEKYKYLGIILDNVKFDGNVLNIYKKMSLQNLLLTMTEEH